MFLPRLITAWIPALLVVGLFSVSVGAMQRRLPCERPCVSGNCYFENCAEEYPSCPGGLCTFYRCSYATCDGGACTFVESPHPACRGGGCKITSPVTTLVDGFCDGGGCTVDGIPWQNRFANELSY